jgi:hypothetical protein
MLIALALALSQHRACVAGEADIRIVDVALKV